MVDARYSGDKSYSKKAAEISTFSIATYTAVEKAILRQKMLRDGFLFFLKKGMIIHKLSEMEEMLI